MQTVLRFRNVLNSLCSSPTPAIPARVGEFCNTLCLGEWKGREREGEGGRVRGRGGGALKENGGEWWRMVENGGVEREREGEGDGGEGAC